MTAAKAGSFGDEGAKAMAEGGLNPTGPPVLNPVLARNALMGDERSPSSDPIRASPVARILNICSAVVEEFWPKKNRADAFAFAIC